MLLDPNPLINWLRFCRWMTFSRVLIVLSIPFWLAIFANYAMPVGFMATRQVLAFLIPGLLFFITGGFVVVDEDSRYWEKRNARYQKMIDEVRELEDD